MGIVINKNNEIIFNLYFVFILYAFTHKLQNVHQGPALQVTSQPIVLYKEATYKVTTYTLLNIFVPC